MSSSHDGNCRKKPVFDRESILVASALIALLVIAVLWGPGAAWSAPPPQYEIKLATLAPENSSLMRVFNEMNAELLEKSGGRLGFKMYTGFALGDEADVLRKLRIGLVHAAVFTNTALTDVNMDLRVLQVPFLFNNYEEVDYILEKLEGDLQKGFAGQGFEVLGWPELGFIYFMSKAPVAGIDDLRGKRVWAQADAPMAQAMIDKAGISTVAITAPDVLMALQTNLLDVVYNSPYYALVTQWHTQLKYITDLPLSYIGGTLLIDKKRFDRLPPELQKTMKTVCARHLKRLVEKTRQDNADALGVMLKRGVQEVKPNPDQVREFRNISNAAVADLGPKVMPRNTLAKVEAALAEFRASHPEAQ